MDKLERVARAICEANGLKPDADTGKGPLQTVIKHHSELSQSYTQERVFYPNWHDFRTKAAEFIAAQAALAEGD